MNFLHKGVVYCDGAIHKLNAPKARYWRAKIQSQLGDTESALQDIEEGLDMSPDHADLLRLKKQLHATDNTFDKFEVDNHDKMRSNA